MIRWVSATLGAMFLLTVGTPGPVRANETPISFEAAEDHLVVHVAGALASELAVVASGDHLEVALDSKQAGQKMATLAVADDTVKRIMVTGAPNAYLSVTLDHSRRTTRKIANAAFIENTDTGVRILFPRKQTVRTWEAPAPAMVSAPVPPADTERVPMEELVETPQAEDKANAVEERASETDDDPLAGLTMPAPEKTKTPESTPPLAGSIAREPSNAGLVWAVVLLAGLGAFVAWRNRKGAPKKQNDTSLDLISHRPLGGKNRILLLNVKGRELLVGVSDNRMTLLDSWKHEATEEADEAGFDDFIEPTPVEKPQRNTHLSPASPLVSGILKLKNQRHPNLSPDNWSGDAEEDREWARALAEATEEKRLV